MPAIGLSRPRSIWLASVSPLTQLASRGWKSLQVRFEEEASECRQKLQSELWVLQSVFDESNEDTPVRNAERAHEVFHTQQKYIDQQLGDLKERVAASASYLKSCHAGTEEATPPVNVELKAREASRTIAGEQVDLAFVAAGDLDRQSLPQWIVGFRMYGLALLIFFIVAVVSTTARADLRKYLNPEFSKPDWEWFGVSCLIGFGVAMLVVTILLMTVQSRLRSKFADILQHTANANAAADFWKQKSRHELKRLDATADTWKKEMEQRLELHSTRLKTAAEIRIEEITRVRDEQVVRQQTLFDDQISSFQTEFARQQSAVENWRAQENRADSESGPFRTPKGGSAASAGSRGQSSVVRSTRSCFTG